MRKSQMRSYSMWNDKALSMYEIRAKKGVGTWLMWQESVRTGEGRDYRKCEACGDRQYEEQ